MSSILFRDVSVEAPPERNPGDRSLRRWVLRAIDLDIPPGAVFTILGPSGSGKTSLLRLINRLNDPTLGEILFDGKPITGLRPEAIVRLGISQVPERRQIFGTMSVEENLILGAYHRFRRDGKREVERDLAFVFDIFPRLRDRISQKAGTLSGGEQQMLALGRAWMARPVLLMMDEPSLGLAPLLVKEIFRVSGVLRDRGMTILMVEQNARAALRLADRAYVMESGRVMLEGAADSLASDERVRTAFLGRAGA